MPTHLETEFKILIEKNTYQKMLLAFQSVHGAPIVQTNEYFQDRQGILKAHYYSLRIRHLDGTYELTLKKPQGFAKLEFNQMLDADTYQKFKQKVSFPSPVLDELAKEGVHIQDLEAVTTLTTTRYTFPYANGTLFLDANRYGKHQYYEVEFEVDNEAEGRLIFQDLMHTYGYSYQQNCPGKMTRALQALD